MAVEVEVAGNGSYAGAKSAIGDYTITEDSTPVEASDSSGGTGQIMFTAVEDPSMFGSMLLLNSDVKLTDGDRGDTEGKINSLNSNDGVLNVTADSRLGRLVIDKVADPVDDTFENVIRYYLSLGGIVSGIAIDNDLASAPVLAPGWTGDLWTKIKELCVLHKAEISLVKGNVVVRPVRQRRALEINNASESWSVQNIDLAREVEVMYYNTEWAENTLVYPVGGWNEDVTVYQVDAGQTTTVNIPLDATLLSIQEPTMVTNVTRDYDATSVYSIVGNDGFPIQPSQWVGHGGSLTVAIGEDRRSIDLTITGASGPSTRLAPFRVAMSSGPSDYYSSLRLIGTGATFKQESVIVPTGASEEFTSRDVGVTVDNIFVRTREDALNTALDVAARWSAPTRTITINKASINRPGETNQSFNYATFGEFDAYAIAEGLVTFADFDAEWAGSTFSDFDKFWYDQVADSFDFQVFGNASGARVQWRRAIYRIRSASITAGTVQYTAEADTTFGDFDESAEGMTFADFDALYEDLTFADFALIPLPQVNPEYDRW